MQLEENQQRLVGFGIAISFLLSLHLNDEKVSANLNSAGSGKDCISPLTRQLIVFLNVLNGEGW